MFISLRYTKTRSTGTPRNKPSKNLQQNKYKYISHQPDQSSVINIMFNSISKQVSSSAHGTQIGGCAQYEDHMNNYMWVTHVRWPILCNRERTVSFFPSTWTTYGVEGFHFTLETSVETYFGDIHPILVARIQIGIVYLLKPGLKSE